MKRKMQIYRDDEIVEVDAEIVKIGLFSFGILWERKQAIFKEHKIVAYELKSGRIVSQRSYRKNRRPKQTLLEELRLLVENGSIEKALTAYQKAVSERKKALKEKYEADINKCRYPLNSI